jgi:hypothetical protein
MRREMNVPDPMSALRSRVLRRATTTRPGPEPDTAGQLRRNAVAHKNEEAVRTLYAAFGMSLRSVAEAIVKVGLRV